MRKPILLFFAILASFFVTPAFCNHSYADTPQIPSGDFKSLTQTGKGRVIEIIDPLTLRLDDGTILSLTGLDYPDLDYYSPGNFSIMTLKILKDFLIDQEVSYYQTKEDGLGRANRMGHTVAHVVRRDDEAWVQGLMLSLGLARVRTVKSNPEMAEQMYAIEEQARAGNTGIWAVKAYQIRTAENAQSAIGGFHVIEGEITKVAMQKNRLFINFGNDWRRDFTVSISGANRRRFAAENLDPQSWSGKKLRVRGWVESFNGPFIEVDHAQQFELLFDPKKKDEENPAEIAPKDSPEEETKAEDKKPKATIIRRKDSALPE